MYEVINISTTTRTYIANGLLTHNKEIDCVILPKRTNRWYCAFQPNYVPAPPFSVHVTATYIDEGYQPCSSVFLASAANYTVTPTAGATYFGNSSSVIPQVSDGSDLYYWYVITVKDANLVSANNSPWTTPQTHVPYCLTPDTLIETYFGGQVLLSDIKVGDELLSISTDTMQYEKTIVTNKSSSFVDELYVINDGTLKCSKGHQHVIKRRGEWSVLGSDLIVVGDTMLDKDRKEVLITKIDILN